MKSLPRSVSECLVLLLGLGVSAASVRAHNVPGHTHAAGEAAKPVHARATPGAVSGQGKMRFRVLVTSDRLPEEARGVLKSAHGGFAVDRRPGKGEAYFALPGAGILQVSSDFQSIRLLPTDQSMKNTNMHNTTIWYAQDGAPYLVFPGNDASQVFTTTLDGRLVHTLNAPGRGDDLGHPVVNDYFAGAGKFVPTDVEYLDGLYYIPTGYSPLDFVLTARILRTNPFDVSWYDLAFGGKGIDPGQFMTGHGITVPPGKKRVDIADRPNSRIERFTRHGQLIEIVKLPSGSLPCDVSYLDQYAVVAALNGPDGSKGAPLYILENDRLVSTIMPKEELGLTNFDHNHNAVLTKAGGKYYILVQAWNPGDFAILEQVTD
jgi:hypothetical protein